MQTLKGDIRDRIVRAARRQFARQGYLKTSMREIAAASGVGVGNIYNYFPNKDAIFAETVRPVIASFERMLQRHHGDCGADMIRMTTEAYFVETVEEYKALVRNCRGLMYILFFRAQGSSLEHFREEFTDRAAQLVKEWLAGNRSRHPEANFEISDFSIHLHTVWMFSLFEEIVMHRIGWPEIERILSEYIRFEIQGWRCLMNL